jgi:hypothetical protein
MRFLFSREAYCETHVHKKVSKNLKIVCAQATQTRTGLSTVRTFSPLGVNSIRCCMEVYHWLMNFVHEILL